MKLYSVEIQVVATAYIVASSPNEALDLIPTDAELLAESRGGFVRDTPFQNLLDEVAADLTLPRVTISPAITINGPCRDTPIHEVEL